MIRDQNQVQPRRRRGLFYFSCRGNEIHFLLFCAPIRQQEGFAAPEKYSLSARRRAGLGQQYTLDRMTSGQPDNPSSARSRATVSTERHSSSSTGKEVCQPNRETTCCRRAGALAVFLDTLVTEILKRFSILQRRADLLRGPIVRQEGVCDRKRTGRGMVGAQASPIGQLDFTATRMSSPVDRNPFTLELERNPGPETDTV